MVSTEVLAVFENTSDQLLELFENFCDLFRNATLHSQAVQFPCSASSNNYARQVQRRYLVHRHTTKSTSSEEPVEVLMRSSQMLEVQMCWDHLQEEDEEF